MGRARGARRARRANDRPRHLIVSGEHDSARVPVRRFPEGFQNPVHAAARYSWMSPPSRSWRSIFPLGWSNRCVSRFGQDERECAMRPLRVVVGHVAAKHVLEVASAEDQQPVETLGADGTHEPLRVGVRLRRPNRRLDHLDPFAAEHFVGGGRELCCRGRGSGTVSAGASR